MGRPGFKPGGWRHASPGGFDSHLLPPLAAATAMTDGLPVDPLPDDLLVLVEHQVWARPHDDGTATVGITALGVRASGEIYLCRAKPPGTEVEQGRGLAVVELAKSIVSVKSPVTGVVVETNARLAAAPEQVHLDPYGAGWIARLRCTAWDRDRAALLAAAAAGQAMAEYARLNLLE